MMPPPRLMQRRWMLPQAYLLASALSVFAPVRGGCKELPSPIQEILQDRCVDCHDAGTKKGGLNLEVLMVNFDPRKDLDLRIVLGGNAHREGGWKSPAKKCLHVGSDQSYLPMKFGTHSECQPSS